MQAEGESRNGGNSGGAGAGGSIVIRALNFDGEGSVTVNGGSCSSSVRPYGGGGAGGRIAVYYNGNYTFIGSYQSHGGASQAEQGGAGTVYIENNQNSSQPYRILTIDNGVVSSAPSRLYEIRELDLTGNPAGNLLIYCSFVCSVFFYIAIYFLFVFAKIWVGKPYYHAVFLICYKHADNCCWHCFPFVWSCQHTRDFIRAEVTSFCKQLCYTRKNSFTKTDLSSVKS